ncbi:MAG: hypothetical protein HYX92_14540 [Chloroflexi bacterium]|nr:hypothetical protein [Chloroflexota bacterium]
MAAPIRSFCAYAICQTRRLPSLLAALGLLLAACAQPPTAVAPQPTAPPAAASTARPAAPSPTSKVAEQPKAGGVVVRLMSRDVPSFDLQREQAADASSTLFNVYQGLVRLHPVRHAAIVPELAESWQVGPEGTTYTFKFYKGIKWHDGKALTMEDVKYSLDRMHNPKEFKTVSPRGEGLLAAMDRAEIAGDSIKIITKYPSASFLLNLATGWIAIEPKHIILEKGDMRRDLVGTGPFKFKDFNPSIGLDLAKNPDYHVKGLPYLDGIKFYVVRDAATRFSAFRTGKAQITSQGSGSLTPSEAELVKREMADKAAVYEHDAQTRYTIAFNLQRKPWDDVKVRRAVDLAFDRQAAVKINERGSIGSIYVGAWGMKPEEVTRLPGYRQPKDADVAEAKKLLAEAGFPNGLKTTLLSRPGGAVERQTVVDRDQLAKIGIDAEIVLLEQAAFFERQERRNFDLFVYNWTDNTGDPDETLFSYYITGGSRNFGNFSDRAIDELIQKQSRTLNEEARKAILAEIEKKILEQVPMVISFWDVLHFGVWKEVRDFRPGPGIHPWGKFDQVWLAR